MRSVPAHAVARRRELGSTADLGAWFLTQAGVSPLQTVHAHGTQATPRLTEGSDAIPDATLRSSSRTSPEQEAPVSVAARQVAPVSPAVPVSTVRTSV